MLLLLLLLSTMMLLSSLSTQCIFLLPLLLRISSHLIKMAMVRDTRDVTGILALWWSIKTNAICLSPFQRHRLVLSTIRSALEHILISISICVRNRCIRMTTNLFYGRQMWHSKFEWMCGCVLSKPKRLPTFTIDHSPGTSQMVCEARSTVRPGSFNLHRNEGWS